MPPSDRGFARGARETGHVSNIFNKRPVAREGGARRRRLQTGIPRATVGNNGVTIEHTLHFIGTIMLFANPLVRCTPGMILLSIIIKRIHVVFSTRPVRLGCLHVEIHTKIRKFSEKTELIPIASVHEILRRPRHFVACVLNRSTTLCVSRGAGVPPAVTPVIPYHLLLRNRAPNEHAAKGQTRVHTCIDPPVSAPLDPRSPAAPRLERRLAS